MVLRKVANPLDGALINCNKNYQRITQERKPVVVQPKLKNVTPVDSDDEELQRTADLFLRKP